MQDVLQKMLVSMELKGFAQSTKRTYLGHIKRFASFINKPLAEADYEDVRQYVFGRKWDMQDVPRLKRKVFLPEILTRDEVLLIINSTTNLKHKAVLSTAYSAGLRVSEIAHLKVSDIDSKNMRIFIPFLLVPFKLFSKKLLKLLESIRMFLYIHSDTALLPICLTLVQVSYL